MNTYQQRKSIGIPCVFKPSNTTWQPSTLQRAIDNGPRMQAQHRQVAMLKQQTVLQRYPFENSFNKFKNWFSAKTGGENAPLLGRNINNDDIESGGQSSFGTIRDVGVNLITAHSPGIYTGPVSAVGEASTVLNFLDKAHKISKSVEARNVNMGFAPSASGLAGDALGGILAVKTIAENVKGCRSDDYVDRRVARAAVKTGLADLGSQVVDAGSQVSSIIGNTSLPVATTASNIAPFLAAPVNLAVGVRATRSWWRARNYQSSFETIANEKDPSLREEAQFAADQMRKRKWRQGIGAVGAALGTAGAISLGVGVVVAGAATLATPIGWGLAGAGAAVALGLGAYKAYRYIKKRRAGELGKDRRNRAQHIIDVLHSQPSADIKYPRYEQHDGELTKEEIIRREQEIYGIDFQNKKNQQDHRVKRNRVKRLLRARGINPKELSNRDKDVKFLETKLKSW